MGDKGIAQRRCFVLAYLTPSFDMHSSVVSVRPCIQDAAFSMCRLFVSGIRHFDSELQRFVAADTTRHCGVFYFSLLIELQLFANLSMRCITICNIIMHAFCNLTCRMFSQELVHLGNERLACVLHVSLACSVFQLLVLVCLSDAKLSVSCENRACAIFR